MWTMTASPTAGRPSGIDFDGDKIVDLPLGVPGRHQRRRRSRRTERADPNHKDLFVEIDWMQLRKPDPRR